MKRSALLVLSTLVLGHAHVPALAADDWVEIKDPSELRALYSNKTFRGNGWIGHYRADGTGVLIFAGAKPAPRTWEVRGKDQVCATPESGTTRCATFKRSTKDPRQILLTFVQDNVSTLFTVEDGVPNF